MKGAWKELHNEELNALCSSPNIVRMIKSRSMKWARHMAMQTWRRIELTVEARDIFYQFFVTFFALNVMIKRFYRSII